MISVVIPTLNSEATLAQTLGALVPAALEGAVREVIVTDGGSTDATAAIVDEAGANLISGAKGRGIQLQAGARAARFPWLLFLHADTVLDENWLAEALAHIRAVSDGKRTPSAAVFRFKLDDGGVAPRMIEAGVRARCSIFGLPYGDQGLLISRALYNKVGGFRPLEIMEDVDIVRRLGRRRITYLKSAARTSAERYKRDGYLSRTTRNLSCLALYTAGLPLDSIARKYESKSAKFGPAE